VSAHGPVRFATSETMPREARPETQAAAASTSAGGGDAHAPMRLEEAPIPEVTLAPQAASFRWPRGRRSRMRILDVV